MKVQQKKRGRRTAIILIHRAEQYRFKVNVYELSGIQFKTYLKKQMG